MMDTPGNPDDDRDELLERLFDLDAGALGEEEELELRATIARDPELISLLDALERGRRGFEMLRAHGDSLEGLDHPGAGAMSSAAAARIDDAIARAARERRITSNGRNVALIRDAVPWAPPSPPPAPIPIYGPPVDTARFHHEQDMRELRSGPRRRGFRSVRRRVLSVAAAAVTLLVVLVTAAIVHSNADHSSPATIATGIASPGRDNIVSPNGDFLYLADRAADRLVIIDLRTSTRREVLTLGRVQGMTLSPDGSTLWISSSTAGGGAARPTARLTKMDAAGDAVQGTRAFGQAAGAVLTSPSGVMLWSVNDTIAVINPTDLSSSATIPVGGRVDQMEDSPDHTQVYANVSGELVTADLRTNTITSRYRIPEGDGMVRLAVNPARAIAATSSDVPTDVALFSLEDRAVIARIAIGPSATMSWPRDGSRLFVTSQESSEVAVVNTSDPATVLTRSVAPNPADLVASPDNNRTAYLVYPGKVETLAL